ncbi:hypothetical protein GLAREA_03288 [Glarea lozoyensis ATCC 20868]|uniref:Uncharacterized protein n=1 Tax=Glarea lozoyensis (strain ATCC 20868 / MF5171) TaxID=1116229 RepID=S3DLE5_GLAL2|nr:uncharacterized protein GLAREA_03288 [Glarea lozoyensis ATCC 20868]EPE27373.1 hypothetical protein GLAREA_03288 [Glarea lozoyensis ATCC 20868]
MVPANSSKETTSPPTDSELRASSSTKLIENVRRNSEDIRTAWQAEMSRKSSISSTGAAQDQSTQPPADTIEAVSWQHLFPFVNQGSRSGRPLIPSQQPSIPGGLPNEFQATPVLPRVPIPGDMDQIQGLSNRPQGPYIQVIMAALETYHDTNPPPREPSPPHECFLATILIEGSSALRAIHVDLLEAIIVVELEHFPLDNNLLSSSNSNLLPRPDSNLLSNSNINLLPRPDSNLLSSSNIKLLSSSNIDLVSRTKTPVEKKLQSVVGNIIGIQMATEEITGTGDATNSNTNFKVIVTMSKVLEN